MAQVFIFAERVRQIIRAGQKEIEIPEGARISAAAAELIKDNQIQVKTIPSATAAGTDAPQPEDKPAAKASKKRRSAPIEPVSESAENESSGQDDGEVSDELLEDIVNRVVRRFREAKGIGPAQPLNKQSPPDKREQDTKESDDLVICRCEEITRKEIKDAIRSGMRTLNGIKRITRAGMGLCQGQTCQRLVTQILAQELGVNPAEVEPTTARGPVRPLRLEVFANS